MGSEEPIDGFVARVVSDTKLVFNRGRNHGVQLGQIFKVMSREGEAIVDPEDEARIIGVLPMEKVRVKVTEVYDDMAVAETYRQRTIGGRSPLADVFGPPREVLETFASDDQSRIEGDGTVRINDPVRQVIAVKRESFG